jgi:ribosomal-protein-alanine N-acetyltransferase
MPAGTRRPASADRTSGWAARTAGLIAPAPTIALPPQRNRWIELRRPAAADIADLVTAIRASRHLHHPWLRAPDDEAALSAWLARTERPDFVALLALDRTDARPVGVFNLSQIFYGGFCNAYLGYYALMPFIGGGWMRAALPLVLKQAFGPLRLHRIEANIQPGNAASIALVRRGGFRLEGFSPRYLKIGGRWRDHERWAITREDWLSVRREPVPKPRS